MKQNFYIGKNTFSPKGVSLQQAVARFKQTRQWGLLPLTNKSTLAAHLPALVMAKDCQALGRDGPPGRARSPGTRWMQGGLTGLLPAFNLIIIQPNIIKLKFNHLQTLNFLS